MEVVVVIAIMTILSAGVLAAIPSLSGMQLRQAVRTIDTMLSKTKTTVMAKGEGTFQLRKETDGSYTVISADGTQKPLASRKGVEVTYVCSENANLSLTEDSPLILTFDKSSGAFLEPLDNDGNFRTDDGYVRSITVTLGSKSKSVKLYPKTGKYEVE